MRCRASPRVGREPHASRRPRRLHPGSPSRLSLVHVSDTPLPETNHHLPLGRGSVDFAVLRGLDVPLILEIGGLPISGGYGLDTDEALLDVEAVSEPSGVTGRPARDGAS